MKIGVIIGSIRKGRTAEKVAAWLRENIGEREGFEYEFIDLADFELPLYDGAGLPMLMNKQYDNPEVTRWSQAVDSCDGFIFITPEYNRTIPGAFKNAYDLLSTEWRHKPFALVSYGGAGGVRAQETWRVVAAAYEMVDVGASVALIRRLDFPEGHFERTDHHDRTLGTVLTRLVELTRALGAA